MYRKVIVFKLFHSILDSAMNVSAIGTRLIILFENKSITLIWFVWFLVQITRK